MKKPFYFDGAFGTYYNEKYNSSEPCEFANLKHPERVLEIHKEYITAGVNAIKTNTFAANLSLTAKEETIKEMLLLGYQLAKKATKGTEVQVFCDIGYIDGERQKEEYQRNVDIFLAAGAKHFIFETLQEFEPLSEIISYLKEKEPSATILVSFSVSQDGYTKKGYFYETLLRQAQQYADIVGLNCQCGPSHLYRLIEHLNLTEFPHFSAMPNAGYPQAVNGRTVYNNNKEYYAQKLLSISSLGVSVLGGCCGTTPEHLRLVISQDAPKQQELPQIIRNKKTPHSNQLLTKLKQGKKILAVEIDPPVDTNTDFLLSAATAIKNAGADLITVADSPLARSRADSIITGAKIKREIEIEVLPHLSCRDKNYIAIKSLLIGGKMEQVNNILVITGDPIPRHEGGIFQFNSYTLMNLIQNLNQEIFEENPYTICGALNINASHFDTELERAKKKIQAGAKILLTQPIFTEEAAQRYILAKKELDCYIFAGILPIAGWKNALFLNNEVTGIRIPETFIEHLKSLPDKEVRKTVLEYSMKLIRAIYPSADGFYLMMPLKKVDLVTDLLYEIQKLTEGD